MSIHYQWLSTHVSKMKEKLHVSGRFLIRVSPSISYHVSSVVDPMVQRISRQTSNGETRARILLETCSFSFISFRDVCQSHR